MTSLGTILVCLSLAGTPATATTKGTRFEQGQRLFNQGDFEAALKQLDAAAQEERDPAVLERLHLLRGQAFSARQDFVKAEDAFSLALDANPEASLDPARVDPTVVKLLESVRARLTGTLVVNATPPGASLFLDGKALGPAPQTVQAAIGRHKVEARFGDQVVPAVEVLLKARREVRVEFVQGTPPPPVVVAPPPTAPEEKPVRAMGEVRGVFEVPPKPGAEAAGALELGGGLDSKYFRGGVALRVFPYFGVVPRIALVVPAIGHLQAFVEVQVPIWLTRPSGGLGVGVGAAAGAEYWLVPFVAVFAQVGGHYLFVNPMRGDSAALVASGGVRLRGP
ncbi:MAG: tetratricopeptide repeat protein [Myxococcaceae bacterium]|nr:tetratricopeptide repeat protein [Myxococcaceae bacterium]